MATKTTAKKEVEVKEENVIDVSKFFSMDNEENGIWFEATVKGVPTGIEFLVYGPNSDKAWLAKNKYQKAVELLDDETDEFYKRKQENALLVDALCETVGGVRGKDGKALKLKDGTEVNDSDIKNLFANAPSLALSVWNFAQRSENFLEMKKKN